MYYIKAISYRLFILFGLVAMFSCENDDIPMMEEEAEPVPLTAGSANLSTYVALGNSLTAGFTDGALFIQAQQNSMPNLLSQKFALVGGGTFTQPLMADNVGGLLLVVYRYRVRGYILMAAGLHR